VEEVGISIVVDVADWLLIAVVGEDSLLLVFAAELRVAAWMRAKVAIRLSILHY
jgi:hypothetical protein